jgi:PhnB protein
MATTLNPYLNFKDDARQAFEFYQSVFGGKLDLNTFGEFNASEDPAEQDKIMHAMLTTKGGMMLMGSDTPNRMGYNGHEGFSVSLSGEDGAELKGYWDKLSDGGTVIMPMEKQVWGDEFGMCVDKFGIDWMVNIFAPKE